ncbi:hypothetical protein EDC19_0033 [Natranaerovirga hydrolytica]|uniref:DUF6128 domain-containing protein n=1 Tax=Natranaerovirga hydrolytica TaxID=680378 RepID=A0A4V2Q1Z7_9FIRM|nr:DUF6128 domain-containing protein [Natranaerovirga hydrolytica]TCL00053.1 hypothetical protein EDC19_0033 [Natranaerovirga hydrolytica]
MKNKYIRQYIDLYTYQYNVKKSINGYAKIDSREDRSKVYVYIKNVTVKEDEVLKAYLFTYKKGAMVAIPIGTLKVENQIGQIKVTTNRHKIMDTNFSIEELSGVVVVKKNYFNQEVIKDTSYGGSWDKDLTLNIDAFREYNNDKALHNEPNPVDTRWEQDPIILDPQDPTIEEPIQEPIRESIPEPTEEPIREPIPEPTEEPIREPIPEPIEPPIDPIRQRPIRRPRQDLPDSVPFPLEDIEEIREEPMETDIQELKKGKKRPLTYKEELERDYKGWQLKEKKYNSVLQDETPPHEILKKQLDQKKLKEMHTQMFEEYPKMAPFERHDDILDCIRIEPKDIAVMPINIWMLMNNTFLLNGYNKYKHLILMKMEDLCNHSGYKYILGVPGIYNKKDRFIAYLYGFNSFKCCCDTHPKPGEYGYWTIDVKENY